MGSEPLQLLLELNLRKERESSGALSVTPSTGLLRPPKISKSIPCIHKGPEQSNFKDLWLRYSPDSFRDLLLLTA